MELINDIPDGEDHLLLAGLPLKKKSVTNFKELSEDWTTGDDEADAVLEIVDSTRSSSMANIKTVRFTQSDSTSYSTLPGLKNGKRDVEEMIYNAAEFNEYITHRLDDIKKHDMNGLDTRKGFYNLMNDSSLHNLKDSKIGSQSNFNLSDMDGTSIDSDDCDGLPFLSKNRNADGSSRSYSELNSDKEDDWIDDIVVDLNQLKIKDEQNLEKRLQEIRYYTAISLKDHSINNEELLNMTVEESMNNFIETFRLILQLSDKYNTKKHGNEDTSGHCGENNNKEGNDCNDKCELSTEPIKFIMKNLPSLSYEDFIKRLQTKCKFNVPLYLSSTYLLQIMFLQRSSDDGSLTLKLQLKQNGLHRLIIAIVRVSCKLLEDQLFSHEYFSKVCGITKKLLTQLELSLLDCLAHERLMITIRKLNSTLPILHELTQVCAQF